MIKFEIDVFRFRCFWLTDGCVSHYARIKYKIDLVFLFILSFWLADGCVNWLAMIRFKDVFLFDDISSTGGIVFLHVSLSFRQPSTLSCEWYPLGHWWDWWWKSHPCVFALLFIILPLVLSLTTLGYYPSTDFSPLPTHPWSLTCLGLVIWQVNVYN